MRFDNELKKAFFLSLLVHLLVLIIFNVDLIQEKGFLKKEPVLSFYGSMLSELSGKKTAEDNKDISGGVSDFEQRMFSFLGEKDIPAADGGYEKATVYLNLYKPEAEIAHERRPISGLKVAEAGFLKGDSISKQNLDSILNLEKLVFANFAFSEGTLSEDEKNLNFRMKIFISEEGKVECAEPLFFSGKPELDMMVRKSVKEWSFIPAGNFSGWYEITLSSESVNMARPVFGER